VRTLADRFLAKVGQSEGCWEWQGFVDKAGYGRIRIGGREAPVGYAHRVSYEMHVGPIPEGLHIDHLCRNRRCCNPWHLEPVTPGENSLRGMAPTVVWGRTDTCKRGHSLTEHAYLRPNGTRTCRLCRRIREARAA
jgi:hypothetical protein